MPRESEPESPELEDTLAVPPGLAARRGPELSRGPGALYTATGMRRRLRTGRRSSAS